MNDQTTPADPFEDEAENARQYRETCKRLDMMPKAQKIALIEQAMERGELPVRATLITPAAHSDEPSPVTHHASAPAPAGEQPEQDSRHNADALEHLRREIIAQPFREPERSAELAALNAQRKPLSPAINIPNRLNSDQASAASASWHELDKLALIRAAAWIVQADGYGIGITGGELDGIASRDPERIAATSRQIVRRLSEIVSAPDADAMAISGSEALGGILPSPE